MESKNKKSIFDIDFLMTHNSAGHFLEDTELISARKNEKGHVLSKNIELDSICTPKNNIVELIKTGFNLPEADNLEEMLSSSCEKENKNSKQNALETDSFKMINLVSKNYNLPEINNDSLLK